MGCLSSTCSCVGNTIFYVVNLLFLVVGIAGLTSGLILMFSFECTVNSLVYQFYSALGFQAVLNETSSEELTVKVTDGAIILLSIGGFFLLVSILAFIGGASKVVEKIAVMVYIVLATIFFAVLVFAIVFFAWGTDKPDEIDIVAIAMKELMKKYYPTTGNTDDFVFEGAMVDTIQAAFHCCGVYGVGDYAQNGLVNIDFTSTKFDMSNWGGGEEKILITVPPTCCRTEYEMTTWTNDSFSNEVDEVHSKYFPNPENINAPSCYVNTPTSREVHTARQCPAAVYQYLSDFETYILIGVSVGAAIFLVLIVCLFVKLCSSRKKSQQSKKSKSKAQMNQASAPVQVGYQQPAYAIYPGANQV